MIISIDGPAGSGKSTTAKIAAEKLGFIHINTGAMYRGITLKCIQEKINPRSWATLRAVVVLPEPAGPSIAIIISSKTLF